MDLHLLETFLMVAKTRNFSRAAVALDYAQSTVTTHIQQLESDLGVPLFNRLGKQIELTEAGEQLIHYGERLTDLAEEARMAVSGKETLTGTLTVGAPETVCTYHLPRVLRRFRMALPQVRLIFRAMSYEALYRGTVEGRVDVAFLLEHTLQSTTLCIDRLNDEPLLIIAAPDHPLAAADSIDLTMLEGESFLMTERGCGYRGIFERQLKAAGVFPTTNMEFESVEAIKQCVIANVGIAVLPQVAVAKEIAAGLLVQLPWSAPDFHVYTYMLWHREKWVSPAMQLFMEISRESLGRLAVPN